MVHTVSYQMARHFNVAVSGVYVANPGYIFGAAGVPRGAVIASANGKPTPDSRGLRGRGDRAGRWRALHGALFHGRRSQWLERAQRAHGPALVPGQSLPARRCRRPVAMRAAAGARARQARNRWHHALLASPKIRAPRRSRPRSWASASTCRIRCRASPSATTAAPAWWSMPRADWWSWTATPCRCPWATCASPSRARSRFPARWSSCIRCTTSPSSATTPSSSAARRCRSAKLLRPAHRARRDL